MVILAHFSTFDIIVPNRCYNAAILPKIVNYRQYVGIKYQWGKSTFKGADCSGFITLLLKISRDSVFKCRVNYLTRDSGKIGYCKVGVGHYYYVINKDSVIHCASKGSEILSFKDFSHYLK